MAGRGGNQPPNRPAAVSNPQSGARTDGGAGSKSQPLRVPTGGRYGEAQALTEQQQGAPLAAGPQGGGGGPVPAGPAQGAPGMEQGGVFGPTTQPSVAPTPAGGPRELMTEDPQMFLRVLYSEFPHPAIAALLRRTGSNG